MVERRVDEDREVELAELLQLHARDGWAITFAENNQHTQVRILQRMLRMEPSKPVEVFSNDPRLLDLPLFGDDIRKQG